MRVVTNARKKVIVRRSGGGLLRGYLAPSGFVRQMSGEPVLALLDLDGREQVVSLQGVILVHFVRDFNSSDEVNPERLMRRTFLARPRTEGLWVRLTLREEEQLEGLAPLDLALANGLADDLGLHLVPPDIRGNTQRIYVPRSAIVALQVIAVVTTPTKRKAMEQPVVLPGLDAQLALALPEEAP